MYSQRNMWWRETEKASVYVTVHSHFQQQQKKQCVQAGKILLWKTQNELMLATSSHSQRQTQWPWHHSLVTDALLWNLDVQLCDVTRRSASFSGSLESLDLSTQCHTSGFWNTAWRSWNKLYVFKQCDQKQATGQINPAGIQRSEVLSGRKSFIATWWQTFPEGSNSNLEGTFPKGSLNVAFPTVPWRLCL